MTTRSERMDWRRLAPATSLTVADASLMLEDVLAGRRIESVELMPGGIANRNFHVRLDRKPFDCVLRLYDRDPSACAREVAVLGLIGRDVPVPRVMFMQDEPQFGPPYSVLSVVDGISLYTLRMLGDDEALGDAAFDAGRVLARLARFPGPRSEPMPVAEVVERRTQVEAFQARIPLDMRHAIVDVAKRWESRVIQASGPSLVHGDFNSPNIFVKQTADGWRVSGVLDWEYAMNGSPFADVGNMLRYHRRERPRYEPHLSAGLAAGGMALPADWLMVARVADLPAVCELLGRPEVPDGVVSEILLSLQEILRDG